MKNTLFLLIALPASVLSSAQDKLSKSELIGEWKPVQVNMNNGAITYDYRTSKLVIADSMQKTWRSADDSAQTVEFLSIMFDEMGKMTMGFKENDVYVEIKPSGKVKQGTYSFDVKNSLLVTDNGQKQAFTVRKRDAFLILETDLDESKKLELLIQKK